MRCPQFFLPLVLVLALLSGCQPSPTPTIPTPAGPTPIPTRKPLSVTIDPTQTRQTLREVGGGNYIHFFGDVLQGVDPVSTMNLNTLNPQVLRVRMDLDLWEPQEGVQGAGRFKEVSFVKATFAFLAEVKKRNPETIVIASIWEVPDWMVTNPDAERDRLIPVERYPQVVDSIGNWLLRAREVSGLEVNYVSFNEASIGVNILLTSEEQAKLVRQGGPQLAQMGLKTLWLLGDTHNMASASSYIPPIYAEEDIRPYLGPLSFHSWDSGVTDQLIRQIGKYADENNLEVWCTEAGWDSAQWHRPEEFSTWKHAIRLANVYTRVLRDSRTTTLLYWDMMGNDYAINDGEKLFPALVYIAELQKSFPAGAQIVATPDDEIQTLSILTLAAKLPADGFSVQVLNQVNEARSITLNGLPDGAYTLIRLTEADGREDLGTVKVSNQQLDLQLPGFSIYFLTR